MATQLVRLDEDLLIEVEADPKAPRLIASSAATKIDEKLEEAFARIQPLLVGAVRPLVNTWAELNKEIELDQAQIQLGLSFEGEGNLYLVKGTVGANFTITLTFKAKPPAGGSAAGAAGPGAVPVASEEKQEEK